MKLSRYTQSVECDGNTIIFNTLNNKRAVCRNAGALRMFKKLQEGESVDREKLSEGMRVFCADDHIDERKVALGLLQSNHWNKQKLGFIVMPTLDCMLRCKYCYENKNARRLDENFMDDFLEAVKAYHRENGLKAITIEWYGGEPLLTYDQIVSFTGRLNEFCDREKIEHIYSMTTNGFLLGYERAETLIGLGIRKYQITVDGIRETHDKLRPHKTGRGSWDTIVGNLLEMKKSTLDFHVTIRVNYDRDVVEHISEFYEFVEKNFDQRFSVFHHVIGRWGGENDEEMEVIDPSTAQYVDTLLTEEAVSHNLKPDMNFFFSKFGGRVCYANRPYFYILSLDRKLRKCTFTEDRYDWINVVGSLEAGRFEIDPVKLLNFSMPDYEKMEERGCWDCSILPICHGMSCALRRAEKGYIDCAEGRINIKDNIVQEYKYYQYLKRKENADERKVAENIQE